MLRRFFQMLVALVGIGVVAIGLYVWIEWREIRAFQSALSGFYSHLWCSCHYVTKQSDEFCHDLSRQYIDISGFRHDAETQSVWVRALDREATARFKGPGAGCVLE